MSEVINRLQELKGDESSPKFNRGSIPSGMSKDEMDLEQLMQSVPIPGESLTNPKDSPLPFERPPEFTDLNEFNEETFLQLTKPEVLPTILDSLRTGLPVESLAHDYLMYAFQKGKISPDLMLLAIEPTIYILIALGTYGNIDMVLYPQEDIFNEEEETKRVTEMFRSASTELNNLSEPQADTSNEQVSVDTLQKPQSISRSLLARAKDAVEQGGT